MIYLAWSGIKLSLVLCVITLLAAIAWRSKRVAKFYADGGVPQNHRKSIVYTWVTCVVLILFTAFNVGTPQKELDRSVFNGKIPDSVEKVERSSLSRNDVQQNFENSIKESK